MISSMSMKVVFFIILGCISGSWQRCFNNLCAHHSPLSSCVSGAYLCQPHEFCEIVTHIPHNSHSNSPWVHTGCRPDAAIQDCVALQNSNQAECDPNKHDIICHWCCDSEQCVKDLAQGTPPTHTMAPIITTTTLPPTTVPSTAAPPTTLAVESAATQTIPSDVVTTTTSSPTQACVDMYIGDCSVDFAGRCSEALIQQLCALTCNKC